MATPLATAFVRIRPDTSGFGRELQGDLNKSGKTFAAAGKKQGGLFRSGFASALALGGGLAAAAGIIGFGKASVREFSQAQKAQNQLSDAFSRFPKLSDTNVAALQRLNTELAKKTRFDDDSIASGQAVIAQFGLTGKQVAAVTPLIADYAAKTGKDFPTAAKLLGKASLGNTRALKDLGVNYKATGDRSKDMAAITDILRQKVGGFAEKEGKTAAGQAEILSNQFGEVQEEVGKKLVPALTKLAGILLSMIDFIGRNSKVIGPLVIVLGTFVGTLFTAVKVIGLINAAMALFGAEFTIATGGLTLIIPAIAALIAGLIIAYKKSDTFRKIVNTAFKAVANAGLEMAKILLNVFKFIVNAWLTAVGFIIKAAAAAFGWVPGIGGKLKKANKAFNEFRKGVVDDFDKAIDKVQGFQDKINKTHGKHVKVTVEMQMKNRLKIAAQQGVSLTITGKPIALAGGGPIRGPGTGTSDSVPLMGSTGEYVIKASSARKLGPSLLSSLNSVGDIGGDVAGMVVSTGKTLKLATGGLVANAQRFVRANAGDPYVWGGVGPAGFDCSGLTGAVYGLLRGLSPYRRYFTTASNFRSLGFRPGTGAYTIGVDPYTHMAGNIGGLPFEAASTRLGIRTGSAATDVRSFARKYYLASLGGVFGGNGSFNLGSRELKQLMHAIGLKWGVRGIGSALTFDGGGFLPPRSATLAVNRTNRAEPVGFGSTYNITVNVPPNANQHEIGRQIVTTIKAYERGSGTGWRR